MELEPLRLTVPEAIDTAGADALADALAVAATDGSPAPIVLAGRPGLFCRGMDFEKVLANRQAVNPHDSVARDLAAATASLQVGVAAFARCLRAIRQCPRPVLATIDGTVLGGGIGIAAACDIVIATRRSTFGLPEALFGLIPAVVLPVLRSRLSAQRASWLAMTAYSRSAEEAHALGLVDVVCADDKLGTTLNRSLRDLGRVKGGAVSALKRFAAELDSLPLHEGLERGVRETTQALSQPDILAAMRGFLHEGEAPWA